MSRLSLLLVEDDHLFRNILEGHLKRLGHICYCAWTVEGALKSLRVERHIDVVLLDILLNGSREHGGLRVAGRVPRDTPIIVISGADEETVRAEAGRNPLAGVVHWLAKPFEFGILADLLDSLPGS